MVGQGGTDDHQEGNVLHPGGIGQLPHGHRPLWPHMGQGAFMGGVCAQSRGWESGVQATATLMQPHSPVPRVLRTGLPGLSLLCGHIL